MICDQKFDLADTAEQNIWNKVKKLSKIRQKQKTLIFTFPQGFS